MEALMSGAAHGKKVELECLSLGVNMEACLSLGVNMEAAWV